MSAWVVVAPAPAGVYDGIGDYASRLSLALDATGTTRLVVSGRDPLPAPDEVTGVLHQYSPQVRVPGLEPWLRALHARHVPIVLTVHEYWPPQSWSPRRAVLRWQNRRSLVSLLRLASAVVVTQEIYARELRAAGVCDGKPITVIPVGSNIDRSAAGGARDGGLVLFGQPASFQRDHLVALATWLVEETAPPRLTWMGRSLDELHRAWEDIAPYPRDIISLVGGAAESEVSAVLMRATLGLAPYANGASGKRTTLAALLQHGVPTVATTGIATDSWLQSAPAMSMVSDDHPRAFVDAVAALLRDDGERERLSRSAEQLYATHMAWPRLAERYRVVMKDAR